MKVLFVTTNAHPFSGSTTQMLHLIQALRQIGHQAHLSFAADEQSGFNTVLSLSRQQFFSTRRVMSLDQLVREFRPDLIHSHIEVLSEVLKLGTPVVVNYGSSAYLNDKTLQALLKPNVKSIVCVSSGAYRHIVNATPILARKTQLIRQSTHFEFLQPLAIIPQKLDHLSSSTVILNVGAVRSYKDPITFTKSLGILSERDPNIKGLWVGPVSERRLRAIAKICNADIVNEGHHKIINSVYFVGPATDIRACLSIASVAVSSSKGYEGISGAIREAMFFGVPVVATNAGHIKELVKPNWNGLLVKKEDPAALAEAIQFTLDNPAIVERQVKRAKIYVRLFFSYRRRVGSHLNLYGEIIRASQHEDIEKQIRMG